MLKLILLVDAIIFLALYLNKTHFNFYIYSILIFTLIFAIKNEKKYKSGLITAQKNMLDDFISYFTNIYILVFFSLLAVIYAINKYIIHNTLMSVLAVSAAAYVGYFSYKKYLKHNNKKNVKIKTEFKNLRIKENKNRTLKDVKKDTYGFDYYYTIDNVLNTVVIKNKLIFNALIKEIEKYLKNNKLSDSFVTKQLCKKFNVEAKNDEILFEVHKKIINKINNIYNNKGIVRVQQLLQYAKNDEEKAFIYFLAQLNTKRFTQLAAQYAAFAIKNKII